MNELCPTTIHPTNCCFNADIESNSNDAAAHMGFSAQTRDEEQGTLTGISEMSDIIKAQIAYHPLYPNLLAAYIACRKVGAPEEMAALLEEIGGENYPIVSSCSGEIGTDPELDEFMKSYCEVLNKYKVEFSKPFDEATSFLSSIESQLNTLCKQTLTSSSSLTSRNDHSTDDVGCGELEPSLIECVDSNSFSREGDDELKQMLMRKYSGYLTILRKDFLKKPNKGKLPKSATSALLHWWNTHYQWPYPTEEEKNKLSETTGLDQKQINNWFINQRKRHWRPSEDMRFAFMYNMDGMGGS